MRTVFIIDDDDMYQVVLNYIISGIDATIKIDSFWNGELGLTALKNRVSNNEQLPDYIFVDINMPVLDGWEFLDELAKFDPQIQNKTSIYLISTSLDDMDRNKALKYDSLKSFLFKPIPIEKLTELLV